ncbi:MAG: bifunctional (p)ppGpp synthetase/guanosine-3',5'-bis(diphosphate) 3'-pyrophosphohydrolase [Clostridia bacterium]|nr:bifunctional (p)ppGpp synthetase/guanosine-3',5'-bis(diphosphate) 3'-pyrophosphohydrolase [Clostridia bacterium]
MDQKVFLEKLEKRFFEKIENTDNTYDVALIRKAYDLAYRAHMGQLRYSGEPFFKHPVEVAEIVVDLGMDNESVVSALLHDVVEDTDIKLGYIAKEFGKDVSLIVDGLTKLGKVPLSTKEEQQAENVRKMLIAMSNDIRVIIIKLADRLNNMRTLQYMSPQKRLDKSVETLEIYAPIAHRLGIRAVKEELEDLAIRNLDPVAYKEVETMLAEKEKLQNGFLNKVKLQLDDKIRPYIPDVKIEGRIKSVHGIYRKAYVQGKSFDEIYDIYAVRLIVNSVGDCYNALGLVHEMYRTIPGRFKDYISNPKPNMYQSLHTTVVGREGIPFEVQIRTFEMHQTAELGIAAHWKYKLGVKGTDKFEERLAWVRQLLDSQNDADDIEEIVRTIKNDIMFEDVLVFTPKGDVITLPVGSNTIDFAYAIHSAVGNRMVGAKVDGRIVPIDYVIKSGEIIEVLTSSQQGKGPSRDWIKMVHTSQARNKIRAWFKKEKREENIEQGREEYERELRRNKMVLPKERADEFNLMIAEKYHYKTVEDFFAAIGYGGIYLSKIMPRIREDFKAFVKTNEDEENILTPMPSYSSKSSHGVIVEGVEDCLVKFPRCCNPLPGDSIIGFITRGYGVSVHKMDCVNVPKGSAMEQQKDRWIPVRWDTEIKEQYRAGLMIVTENIVGQYAETITALAKLNVIIHTINARETKDGRAIMTVAITVNGSEHLKNVLTRLAKEKGVISVERTVM